MLGHSHTPGDQGMRLLLIALAGTVLYHGGLLPFTHGNTYDAFIHMFFGDSYHRSWFDPWEPRWYTGFATTSYPPGTHMAIAGLMNVVPLRAAFVVVQLSGLLLLVVGVYRFSLLWVTPKAAGLASIFLVLSSAVSETVHLFGQLPTICSLGIFLNGLPYVYRWIVYARPVDLLISTLFAAATTAAHHVTTIFGGVLFIFPLGLYALRVVADLYPGRYGIRKITRFLPPLGRGIILAVLMVIAMVTTVFPYWSWSVNDPITQVPIPHGSRESFIERPDLGLVFFVIPWGLNILFLPYVIAKTITTRLWPLGGAVLLCFVLGTGGTTPISRAILGGAFDILTLDRFTFWANILILPFIGLMVSGLLDGRSGHIISQLFGAGVRRLIIAVIFVVTVGISVFAAILPTMRPTQPDFIDPAPIAQFLAEDQHDRWRYLTLGFGDQFAFLSAHTTAQSVDGNYHSARRLPDLTRFSVERLENSKYLGVPGLGSLQQFLVNAERYHLKYVFANDEFYDPILHFTGWRRLNKLANGVTIWEKPDISPLPIVQPRREFSSTLMLMWGLLPPVMLSLAGLVFVVAATRRNFGAANAEFRPFIEPRTSFKNHKFVRNLVIGLAVLSVSVAAVLTVGIVKKMRTPASPQQVVETYFNHLDFRRFQEAYGLLDPLTRPPFDTVMFGWRWRGGLVASYGKLTDARAEIVSQSDGIIDWAVELDWLTAVNLRTETLDLRTVLRDGRWHVVPQDLRAVQAPVSLQRQTSVDWNVLGRRQPRPETDLHRDRLDRPNLGLWQPRLVEKDGRYSIIGGLSNLDVDPAAVSIFSNLKGMNWQGALQSVATVGTQRLLPAETTGYRIDFEGVLSLEDEAAKGSYDPTLFIPPELPGAPETANLSARALVSGTDLYRGVALNSMRIDTTGGHPVLTGLAVNNGTQTASIVRVVVSLADKQGAPIWVEAGYVETNLYPGQSAPVRIPLPNRSDIQVIADIPMSQQQINGSDAIAEGLQQDWLQPVSLLKSTGYGGFSVQLSTMTYDPTF